MKTCKNCALCDYDDLSDIAWCEFHQEPTTDQDATDCEMWIEGKDKKNV